MTHEIEVKFLLDERSLNKVLSAPLVRAVASGAPRTEHLVSTYFDSADLKLRSRKMALRVRRTPTGFIQTLKGESTTSNGLSNRPELEWPIESESLVLEHLRGTAFEPLLEDLRGLDLQAVFCTDFERQIQDLILPDGTLIELALDQGWIIAGNQREPICELELEFKGGSQVKLMTFCTELKKELGLTPGELSKGRRGYALFASQAD